MVANSSTELIPANYLPKPILCIKSNVTSVPRGTNGTATGKKVSFGTPLTCYSPLANPFMFQNITAALAQQYSQQPTTQAQSSNIGGRVHNGLNAGSGVGNGMGTVHPSLPATGAGGNGLLRPASASAALHTSSANNNFNNAGVAGGNSSNNASGESENPAPHTVYLTNVALFRTQGQPRRPAAAAP
jgi:hypothetical protein